MDDLFVVPSPRGEGYVELARVGTGKLFRKQILRMNQTFVHPKDKKYKITVTPQMADSLVENFHKGYCDTVQFPVTDSSNAHDESVLSNLGEVIDLERNDKGVYATIDARKHAEDVGKTILGASAFFSLDYEDTATGKRVGPTLLHVAATNRPYLTNLEPYEEVVAASSVAGSDVVMLSDEDADTSGGPDVLDDAEEPAMELDEMLAELRDKYEIDVPALQDAAARLEAAETQLQDVQLSATQGEGEITSTDLAEALLELSNTVKDQGEIVSTLRTENSRLIQERTEGEIDRLIGEGRVLPKQRAAMVELALSNREMFDQLVPESPIVSLSEDGVTVFEEPEKVKQHDAEVDRYVALAARPATARKRRHGGE